MHYFVDERMDERTRRRAGSRIELVGLPGEEYFWLPRGK